MTFYIMYAESCVDEYVKLPGTLKEQLIPGCLNSEFQYLDHSLVESEISEDGGLEFPDFLVSGCIPLISERCKMVFDELHIDNVFYKPIQLTFNQFGIKESYWLALPPRINCLNREKCGIVIENNEFLWPDEKMQEATRIIIDPSTVGNYKIFKLANVVNQDIIVTEEVKWAVEQAKLENIYFETLEGDDENGSNDKRNFEADF